MAFGFRSQPTIKYVYGTRVHFRHPTIRPPEGQPFPGHDEAVNQMFAAERFRNALVAVERSRRDGIDPILFRLVPTLATPFAAAQTQSAAVTALRRRLADANQQAGTKVADPALAGLIRTEQANATRLWADYRAARAAAFKLDAVKAALAAHDADAAERRAAARTQAVQAGLYWATANHYLGRVKVNGDDAPQFRRPTGEGACAVQFQRKPDRSTPKVPVLRKDGRPRIHPRSGKPMMRHESGKPFTVADAFAGTNNLLRLEPHPINPKLVLASVRVASDANHNPIWATVVINYHRPIPPDAEIVWAYLIRTTTGTYRRWELHLDLARKEKWDTFPAHRPRAATGTVAVALGWRKMGDELRVAYWVGSDGRSGEIRLPPMHRPSAQRATLMPGVSSYVEQVSAIQSIRDGRFNAAKQSLTAWIATHPGLPPEFTAQVQTLPLWKSPRRLARFVHWWRHNRVPGDDVIWAAVEGHLVHGTQRGHYEGWRKQDKHLYDWQAGVQQRFRRWRSYFYRHVALDLAAQYKDVVTATINYNDLAENPEIEDADQQVNKTNRGTAACAKLKSILANYMNEVKAPAEHIVVDCHRCGCLMPHPERGRIVRCERCGENWDRAFNAAQNLLGRALGTRPPRTTTRGPQRPRLPRPAATSETAA